ncbi:MAG: hypothetical protein WC455_19085 [Dehalococcoidia bacterium]|jgi:hypothetical protein
MNIMTWIAINQARRAITRLEAQRLIAVRPVDILRLDEEIAGYEALIASLDDGSAVDEPPVRGDDTPVLPARNTMRKAGDRE